MRIACWTAIAFLALCGAAQDAHAKKQPAQPTLKELVNKKVEVQPEPPIDVQPEQAADEYRRFLERANTDERLRVEAMRRLGDLSLETDEADRSTTDPSHLSAAELKEAIKLYEKLLAAYPHYDRADAVLYQLARAYEAEGELDKSLAGLSRLVKDYPQSRWVAEAHFRRGEILFSAKRYNDAERAYKAVVALGPTTAFYDQALYKDGWSLFKLARADESVASFMALLDRILSPQGTVRERAQLSRPERELTDDAMRAISVLYLDMDGPASLDEMLAGRKRVTGAYPPYTHLLYGALGNLYLEKERYQDAARAFEAFAKGHPDDRQAPSLQVRAIDAYEKGGFDSLVLEGKQAFVVRYAFGSPFWANRTVQDAPEVAEELKSNLKDLAQYYHAEAQKNKKPEDYQAATRWYRQLLDSFPNDPSAPETRFLLADLLYESGHFGEAAHEYERTAYEYPPHAKSAQAGYAALLAYPKHEVTLTGEAKAKWHLQGIESALMFATSFPKHPEVGAVLTKTAEQLFELKEMDRTIEVTQQILALQPPVDAKKLRVANTLLAHSLFDRKRYEEAEAAYLRVQALLPPDDPERPAIVERIAASIYEQGAAKQAAGDMDGAVAKYLSVVTLAPTSKIRLNAEFDAATLLVKQSKWDKAIPVLEQFRQAHPDSEFNKEVTRNLAVAYQETGRGGAAAEEFERIAATASESPDVRRSALWQAAELFEKAGNPTRAARAYANYVTQFPTPLDPAMDARQHLVDIASAAHDYTTRNQWLDEIIRVDAQAGAARTDRSRFLAAKASLIRIEPAVEEFKSIKLVQPLAKSLKAKKAAMDKVLGMYSRALDYQVAEVTTAATFGMAELYRRLSADVLASERPSKLSADALEEYNVLLEEQAYPFEEQAIKLHEANAKRAADGIYDEWVKKSFDALAKLMPARYAKAEIGEDYVPTLR